MISLAKIVSYSTWSSIFSSSQSFWSIDFGDTFLTQLSLVGVLLHLFHKILFYHLCFTGWYSSYLLDLCSSFGLCFLFLCFLGDIIWMTLLTSMSSIARWYSVGSQISFQIFYPSYLNCHWLAYIYKPLTLNFSFKFS